MPTYEYECLECGCKFELFQQMTAKPAEKCRGCSGRVRRLPGAGAGVIYKGAGFYTTEYRSESYRKGEREEKSCPASSGASCASGKCDDKKCKA